LGSTALTVLNNNPTALDVKRGGIGFNSKLFKLAPATIQLVQRMSTAEGAKPGTLRVKESGQMFQEMRLVLLFEPIERRSYFEGEDYSPDNQLCFSLDNVAPHPKAKIPQAMSCDGCEKSSWEKFRQTGNKADIPKCKNYWHNVVVDRTTQLPYYLDIKSTSIKPYMKAMQNLARLMALAQSKGENPNIFDISFTVYPVSEQNGKYFTYGFKDFAMVDGEEREKFGQIFLDFVSRKTNIQTDEAELVKKAEVINAEIVDDSSDTIEGEIVI
jgi:hypothetical protein